MNVHTVYIVVTAGDPPNHDHGSWSRHNNLAHAVKLAGQVGGDVWAKVDTDGDVIMTRVKSAP